MATQDFTLWTEVDPNGRIAKTADRITFTALTNSEDAHVYDDKGADFFDGNFVHDFTIFISAITVNQPIISPWALANSVDDMSGIQAANGDFLGPYILYATGNILRIVLRECDGGTAYDTGVLGLSLSTLYYCRVSRDESAGTYGKLSLALYTDAARTVQHGGTLTLTLHSSKKDFQYIYGLNTWNSGSGDTITGYVEDLDIDVTGAPTVTTQAVSAILEHTGTANGTIVSIGQAAVSQHGVCYSLTQEFPTLSNSLFTEEGAAAAGAFTSNMSALPKKTKIYVRAYATNTFGTGYGNVVYFYTDPNAIVSMAFGQSIFTASPNWDDVSADVIEFTIQRGRNHDLARIEAGTAIITLKNIDGNYWRYNTGGDYYPDVKPLSLVRISAVWNAVTYRRFYGIIESFRHSWIGDRGREIPIVTVSCVDVFKSLARLKLYKLPGTVGAFTNIVALVSNAAAAQKDVIIKSLADSATEGCDIKLLHVGQSVTIGDTGASEVNTIASIDEDTYTLTMTNNLANAYTTANDAYVKKWPAVLSGTRVNDVLYELGWPAALTDIDAGQVTVIEYVPGAGGEAALKHLQDVAESEGGIIFVAGLGKVVFQDRDARLSTASDALTCLDGTLISLATVQATFSDDGNDQKYVTAEPEDDDALIYNEAIIDGDGVTGQLYRDVTAQAIQGARGLSRTGSLLSVDAEAFDQAYTIVNRYNDSILRVPSITLLPDADASNLYPKVLLYELSTRINLELGVSPNIANLDKDYHIEGITDRFVKGKPWETKWQLWDVNLFRIFQAEHDGYLQKESVVSYADCHDAAAADSALNDDGVIAVGQFLDGAADWFIWRGFLQFDTSDIGAAATIAKAEIILEVTGYFVIDNEWDLTLVAAGGGVANPLVVGDYGTMEASQTSYGSVTIATSAINKRVIIITLNATGIAAINKTGTTYFGLRSSKDISDTSPGAAETEFITVEGVGSSFVPRLVVELNEAF